MALNFPDNPTLNDVYIDSASGFSYKWNGTVWISFSPSSSSQIQVIDDISGSFNGSTQTFTLTSSGSSITPASAQSLIINLGGIVQDPTDDYSVSGSNITFSTAPSSGLTFSGVSLGPAIPINTIADGSITPAKLSTGGPSWNTSGDITITDKIIHSGDTNTAIRFPAADTFSVETNGSERLRVDSSGRLGLGNSSPGAAFDCFGAAGGISNPANGTINVVDNTAAALGVGGQIVFRGQFQSGAYTQYGAITAYKESATVDGSQYGASLVFNTRTQGGNNTEKMRIDSSGRVGIGITSPATRLDLSGNYAQNIVAVAALDIDCSAGNYFTKTINGNSTFTVSNVPASRAFAFTLELTHTSGTITWFSGVEWPGGVAPTLTTGKTHLFMFVTDDGGTRWRASSLINYTN